MTSESGEGYPERGAPSAVRVSSGVVSLDHMNPDALGLVVGTVPATPLQFSVGLAPGQYVQLDDVVVTQRRVAWPARSSDRGCGDER